MEKEKDLKQEAYYTRVPEIEIERAIDAYLTTLDKHIEGGRSGNHLMYGYHEQGCYELHKVDVVDLAQFLTQSLNKEVDSKPEAQPVVEKKVGSSDLINKTLQELKDYVAKHSGSELAVENLINYIKYHASQKEKGFTDYLLQKNCNWFGKFIPAGTLYVQVNADEWVPVIDGARLPSMMVDFYTVRNNESYFKPFEFEPK